MKARIKKMINYLGFDLVRYSGKSPDNEVPHDICQEFLSLYHKNRDILGNFTPKLYTTYKITEYLVKNKILGDFIECGVYKGRQIALMALTLKRYDDLTRDIYLYDTFAGMTIPTHKDFKKHRSQVDTYEKNLAKWKKKQRNDHNLYCYAPLDMVKKTVRATGYPDNKIHYVVGDVRKTIPNDLHRKIAFLRLDTDWYELTKHELVNLFPLVVHKGATSVDDYGSWQGARDAVDEFLAEQKFYPLLFRTGTSERAFLKLI